MSASSVLRIDELTGKRRAVELKGPGLPLQGVEWSGLTTIVTQWNPGNPEATQQVLGPREVPTTMRGVWRTTQLAAYPCLFFDQSLQQSTVAYAYTLANLLDSFRMDGQLLRVTWHNRIIGVDTNGNPTNREHKISRTGRLEQFRPKYVRMDDIEWEATFVWIGREAAPASLVDDAEDLLARLRAANIASSQAAVRIISDDFFGSRQAVLFPDQFSIGQLEALADAPRQLVNDFARAANGVTNRLKRLGDLVIKIRETPAAIFGRVLDVANNAVAVSNQFIDQISRRGPESISASNKVSTLTSSWGYYTGSQTEAELVRNACNDLARAARRRRNASDVVGSAAGGSDALTRDILAVYIPREGDTFASISIRFYESDVFGSVLARVNGVPSYTVVPPRRRPVIIPSRTVIETESSQRV